MSTPGAEERHTPRPGADTRRYARLRPSTCASRSKRTCIRDVPGTAPICAEKTAKRCSGAAPARHESSDARVGTVCAAAAGAAKERNTRAQALLRTAPEEQHAGGEVSPPARVLTAFGGSDVARTSFARVNQVIWYSGPSPPSGVVRRPPLAVMAPHCTQLV